MLNYLYKLVTVITTSTWYSKLIVALFVWFTPALEATLLLFGLVLIDTITGIWCSEEKFSSKRLKDTIQKICLYGLFILTIHSLQVHHIKQVADIFKLLVSIPVFRETISICENIEKKTGVSLVKAVKNILYSFFNKLKKED